MVVTIMILAVFVYYDVHVHIAHMNVRYLDIYEVCHDACCRIAVLTVYHVV